MNDRVSYRKLAFDRVREEESELVKAVAEVGYASTAQELLQTVAQEVQQNAHRQIARVVSKCLSAVFEEPYELRINFVRKRGGTEAVFVYLKHGYEVEPGSTSGGVLDVCALALRLAGLVLALPPSRKTLVLDEPFRAVSRENLSRVARLIEVLAEEMGVQIILVTHNQSLEVGKVIRL